MSRDYTHCLAVMRQVHAMVGDDNNAGDEELTLSVAQRFIPPQSIALFETCGNEGQRCQGTSTWIMDFAFAFRCLTASALGRPHWWMTAIRKASRRKKTH